MIRRGKNIFIIILYRGQQHEMEKWPLATNLAEFEGRPGALKCRPPLHQFNGGIPAKRNGRIE